MTTPTALPVLLVKIDDLVIEAHPAPPGGTTVRTCSGDVLAVLPDLAASTSPGSQYAIIRAVAERGYTVAYDPMKTPSSVRHRVVVYDKETGLAMFATGGTFHTYNLGTDPLPEWGTVDRETGILSFGTATIEPSQLTERDAAVMYGLGAA